ncbi:hypothetical protein [Caldichromatium japonicum]|uniref:hypothetical protein n=1 Tax=Caldichromatium japonicum TaxID=2699430 RepID=UPI001B35571E|nr:hypothetical protein [Caldichromatium japonicum]
MPKNLFDAAARALAACYVSMTLPFQASAAEIQPLQVAVIKATTGLCLRGQICHKDRAGSWTPRKPIAILAVSAAEQADVDLYADIEVSTKPEMYQCAGEDARGCIFRAKYSGPGLFDYAAQSGSTYLGSNITTTALSFPAGYGIHIPAGEPIYVHLDVHNASLIDLKVDQDVWLYYTELK